MKIKVAITKTYYKAATIEMDVPDDIDEQDIEDYLYELDWRTSELTSALADSSLNAAGDMEVEGFDILENTSK